MRYFAAISLFIAAIMALPVPQGGHVIPVDKAIDEVKSSADALGSKIRDVTKRDDGRTFDAPLSGDLDGISPLQHFGDVTVSPDLDHPTFGGKRDSGSDGKVIAPLSGDLDGISPLQNFGDVTVSPDLDHPTFGGKRDTGKTNAEGDGDLDGISPLQNFGELDLSPDLDHPTFGQGSIVRKRSGGGDSTDSKDAGILDGFTPFQNFGEVAVSPDLDHPTVGDLKRDGLPAASDLTAALKDLDVPDLN